MNLFATFSVINCLAALFANINNRYLKLPSAIGYVIVITKFFHINYHGNFKSNYFKNVATSVESFNFSELLIGSMLSFMLFVGAIHITLSQLK